MAIKDDLENLEEIESVLTENKVSNFAYTNTAYEDNDADGVEEFDITNENNIPIADASVLSTDSDVLDTGFRSQASSVTRMLLNHFFGRVSYNLNKTVDVVNSLLYSFKTFLGKANGIATLDENGRIPYEQLPESAMEFKGTWNALDNVPALQNGVGRNGDFYIVSVAGTQLEQKFYPNDRIIYDGSTQEWTRLEGNVIKVPVGFVYHQLYNPSEEKWEASPVDLYPNNEWTEITSDFEDFPFFRVSSSATTGLGHNAEHSHEMNHKHRMEHTHSMSHTHAVSTYSVTATGGSSHVGWTANTTWKANINTGAASTSTTGSSSYLDKFTGESEDLLSVATTEGTITKTSTGTDGSGNYPEPNWCGERLWRCVL